MTATDSTLTRTAAVALAVLVVASLGSGPVASMAQDAEGEPAELRVAHMSPDAPEVDVLVDNETAFEGLDFGDVTEFVEVESGDHQVTIVTSRNGTEVFSGQVSLRANESYTVAAAGEVSENATRSFDPVVLRTDPAVPSGNDSSARLVHLSPDAPAVDVTLRGSGAVVADNLTYGNATEYATLESGVYTFEVRAATADNNGTVVATFNESLLDGTAYTGFVSGYLAPDEAPADEPLDLFVAVDATAEAMTEMTTAETTTAVEGTETTTVTVTETVVVTETTTATGNQTTTEA